MPPGRTSISRTGTVQPGRTNQRANSSGLVQQSNTSARGALKLRVITISRWPSERTATCGLFTVVTSGTPLLHLFAVQFIEQVVQPLEGLLPVLAEPVRPLRHLFDGRRIQARWAPLRLAPPRDQPRPLEHLQVLRNRGQAHLEWFGEGLHRGLALAQTRQH